VIGPRHKACLSDALAGLLGKPVPGAVAFLRCMTSEQVDALVDGQGFDVPGWRVSAVVDIPGPRRITADQAVEQREDKADPVLFLVDPLRAGAGLDGIYSAAREIGEAELFRFAQRRARGQVKDKAFLDSAVRRAGRLGRRRQLTPWQVFDFTVGVIEDGAGQAIARLGLWPVLCELRMPVRSQIVCAHFCSTMLPSNRRCSSDSSGRSPTYRRQREWPPSSIVLSCGWDRCGRVSLGTNCAALS
jgi:DNA phosphorothioation-dependent restriction protein DptH